MFCNSCGKEVRDDEVICISCGCAIKKEDEVTPTSKLIPWAYVCAFLLPLVGFILGVILLVKGKIGHGFGAILTAIFMYSLYWFL